MKEFFGIGGYQRTPEGAFSWQHLLFVTLLMVIMVLPAAKERLAEYRQLTMIFSV